jgi:tetratricopeptide (TPR) repeat protein
MPVIKLCVHLMAAPFRSRFSAVNRSQNRARKQAGLLLLGTATLIAGSTEEGLRLFHAGKYTEARDILKTAAASDPKDAHARTFLALSRAATGECSLEESELSAIFEDAGTPPDLRRMAGAAYVQCLTAKNKLDDALAVAGKLQRMYPNDADVLYHAARLHMRVWNEVLRNMFVHTPASWRVNQLSGEILETQGKYGEAAAEYRKAIAKNATALNLHYRLGRALLLDAQTPAALEEASREFEAELKLNPNDAVAEYQLAQILIAQQKSDLAAVRLKRALDLHPDFVEPMVALARLRSTANQHDEAIQLLESATRLQPRSESARYALMLAYRNAGRLEDASKEKAELERLQNPPEGEFADFLKRLGEKPVSK